jgi:hypothetical protein
MRFIQNWFTNGKRMRQERKEIDSDAKQVNQKVDDILSAVVILTLIL